MPKAKLPIGIQDFETIISDGYTYIDKTELIYHLITQGKSYFLSRPRRFGKSLLLSTFQALFSEKRHLFKDLWINNSDWNWGEYPIIRLDMSTINNRTPEMFETDLIRALNDIASQNHIRLTGTSAANYLQNLIIQLSTKQKVVVLIDEYDKALIDHIENPELAEKIRNILRQFYTILKAEDAHLRFIFLVGVTKFSKVSVFSGLNSLDDLTMVNDYSALLGYTKEELVLYFKDDIKALAQEYSSSIEECLERIKEWYNGYRFSDAGTLVFNPFSVLRLFRTRRFQTHWFETGTPTFLIKLLQKREFDLINLEQYEVGSESFSTFDIEELPTFPLLYQTGYLTIKTYDPSIDIYRLGHPNREVAQAFSESILRYFATAKASSSDHLSQIYRNLQTNPWDYSHFFSILSDFLALIPYDLYLKQEKHYQSLLFIIIKLAGLKINAEIHTQQGRVDAAIEGKDKIIIFEFKLNQNAQAAIDQIKQKKYYLMFQDRNLPVYLAGINFNGDQHAMDDWKVELLSQ